MYILVILGYIMVGVIEMVPLYKKNKNRELVVYSFFFASAFILSLLLSLGVEIPSPAKPIEKIVKTIIGK